ncbi:MAG: ElyC/SanA/YdcF family protein [Anaerolineaceae bacterium]|nr:ElyC/SanA/YdcF family protein [Anaerolineaceae bacterium]
MWFSIIAITLLLAGLLLWLPRLLTHGYAQSRTYGIENVPQARAAIVFGAGLQHDGSPAAVLKDRVETAAKLYFAGKVEKLLMSGDNRFVNYNEPGAMLEHAESLGVPREDIVLDYAGRRTYDTCYRARFIFGIEEAILVTQKFHLPRALYTCSVLGINSTGVAADQRVYRRAALAYWQMRETPATLVALWELWVSKPIPVLGNPEPIFPPDEATG